MDPLSLSEEDLSRVWAAYANDRSPAALELLIGQYAGLAGYLGRKALAKAPPHQDREDILSFAHHGLLDAIQRFDPQMGVKFETYATRRITGAIIDAQRKEDPLGRQTRRKVKLVQAAIEELSDEHILEPSTEVIADRARMTVEEVRMALLARQSLNASLDAEEHHVRGMTSEAEVVAMMAELRAHLAARLAALSPRARLLMLKFYVDDMGMKEIHDELGISPAWCRQMRSAAMHELRS